MIKRLVFGILAVTLLVTGFSQVPVEIPVPTLTVPSPTTLELSQAKVACLYESVISGGGSSRTMKRIINILKETKTDFVDRGFFKHMPLISV
ncbi:hypothetical protein ACFLXT_04170 [Chloroflexota bacterium]